MRASHAASAGFTEIHTRPLAKEDSDRVAAIHEKVFADTPSSRLGHSYCRKLYGMYATEDGAFGQVLLQDGEPVGFVVGGDTNTHERISQKLRRQAALTSIVRPKILFLWTRNAISKRFKKGRRTQTPAAPERNADHKRVSKLFLIGILEKARGTGGARQLLDSFVDHAFFVGFDTVVLTVHRANSRARNAYEKAGWILNDRGGESVEYYTSKTK